MAAIIKIAAILFFWQLISCLLFLYKNGGLWCRKL